jgi:alpha-tubulin suppressor-like RCC1 family protein
MLVHAVTPPSTIAGGLDHSMVLKADGTVWSWGSGYYGQLGNGSSGSNAHSSTPVEVSGLSNVTAIAAGTRFSLAMNTSGIVWAWGNNSSWQLGNGTMNNSSTPVQLANITSVPAIAAGYERALALKSDCSVWAWGGNDAGQLGNGTTTSSSLPVQVSNLSGVSAIAAGGDECAFGTPRDERPSLPGL